jgi:hypothetical protein
MKRVLLNIVLCTMAVAGFFLGILIVGLVAILCFRPPFDTVAFIILLCLFFYAIDPDKHHEY